jgi:hypothetical protein
VSEEKVMAEGRKLGIGDGGRARPRAFHGVVAALCVAVVGLVGGCKAQQPASCVDSTKNGNETDVDCGGACIPCDLGRRCGTARDCLSLLCVSGACVMPEAPSCTDGVKNGVETDVDCGGGCTPCADGKLCSSFSDCASVVCSQARCQPPSCTDGAKNSVETDIDCGGPCGGCRTGRLCHVAGDCASLVCSVQDRRCVAESCTDALKNGTESDVDCGGSCGPCPSGKACGSEADCQSLVCGADSRCALPSCSDKVRNGQEPDVDCGAGCAKCVAGRSCAGPADCQSGVCGSGFCAAAACNDGIKNGTESDVDCGGSCGACLGGRACAASRDCDSVICNNNVCATATCSDGVKNGSEGDVDCGGSSCGARCGDGLECRTDSDCGNGQCGAGNRCSALTAPAADPKSAVSTRPSVRDAQGTLHTLLAVGDKYIHVRQSAVGGGQSTAVTASAGEYLFHRFLNRTGAANYRVVINSTGKVFLFYTTTRGPVVSDRDKDVPYLATYTAQGGWTAPVNLRASGVWPDVSAEYHTGMDVVVDASDNLHLAVVFTRYSASDFLEYFQLSPDASTQIKRTRLHEERASRPTLLVDEAGTLHLAHDESVSGRPIWYRSSDDGGSTWGAPVAVTNGTGSTDPTIGLAVTGSGAGRARWLSHRGAENQLQVLRSTDGLTFAQVYTSSEAGLDHGGSRLLEVGGNLHVLFAGPTAVGARPRLRRVILDAAGAAGSLSTLEAPFGTYGTLSFGLPGSTFPSFNRSTVPTLIRHWIGTGAAPLELVLSTEVP